MNIGELRARRDSGESLASLARELGVPRYKLQYLLSAAHEEADDRRHYRNEKLQNILDLKEGRIPDQPDYSWEELAEIFGYRSAASLRQTMYIWKRNAKQKPPPIKPIHGNDV